MVRCWLLVQAILGGIVLMSMSTTAYSADLVTSVEGIDEYVLPNGLKVLLFHDPSKPQVTVNLTVFVGSRHEGYGEAGMAHLLEHMLFKGTPAHPEIPKVLKDHGADFNGTTWLDRTNYFETLPATDDNLEFAIRLEADRMVNSYVKGEDLTSEMTVVRNEFERGENDPESILGQRVMATAFEWHNYGKSTIGNRADIERVPIVNLQNFYRKYYQPDNAMLIVAGQFETDKALELIDKHFGIIPRPDRVLENTYTEEPAQDGERLVTLRRVGDVAVVEAVYHICSGAHPDYVPLDCLQHILTSSPSGRLYKALVETKRAASISGTAYSLHDPGVLDITAKVSTGNEPRDILTTMTEIIEQIGEEGVTDEEVERARQAWLKTWELSFTNSTRLARQLSEWAAQGDWRLMFLYRDRLEKVTAAEVQQVARKYLRRNNRTAGLFLPTTQAERVTIPPTPLLAEMVGEYKGREKIDAGEAFDVSPANIEDRTERFELPGGLKVAFLPKKTRGNSVNARVTLRYGSAESLKGLNTACEVLPALMMRGTDKLNRQQIQDELDKYRARVSPSGLAGEASFDIETRREFLPSVLNVLRQILREPTLPGEELDIIRNAQIAQYEQLLTDPTTLARVSISRVLNPGYDKDDVRYVNSPEEEVERWKKIQRDDVMQLYRDYLGASSGEIAIVGDFDAAEIKSQLNEIFGGWASAKPYARITRDGKVKVPALHEVINTPDKENATYIAGTVLPLSDASPEYPAMLMGNHVLGSSGLASRLGDRVRQKEGLSYSVGSMFRASSLDERATFMAYAIMNPDNREKVEKAIREELELIVKEGITESELASAKKGYLENQKVEFASDASLVRYLSSTLQEQRSMLFYRELEDRLLTLSTAEVQATLKKYLDLEHLAIAVAGDFERAKK